MSGLLPGFVARAAKNAVQLTEDGQVSIFDALLQVVVWSTMVNKQEVQEVKTTIGSDAKKSHRLVAFRLAQQPCSSCKRPQKSA